MSRREELREILGSAPPSAEGDLEAALRKKVEEDDKRELQSVDVCLAVLVILVMILLWMAP